MAKRDNEKTRDKWTRLDRSRDWRHDGPFDIGEVDLEGDDTVRIDLGAMIVTPEEGMTVRLVTKPDTKEILYALIENRPQSSMQLQVLAAPAEAADYCAELRQEIIDNSPSLHSSQLAIGPFGTEVRRVLRVPDAKGRDQFAALRDWLIAGPRWVLHVRLIGQAAIDEKNTGVAGELMEVVRNIIVRRGDVAMVPGSQLPLVTSTGNTP